MPEFLTGFIAEARNYVRNMRAALAASGEDASQLQTILQHAGVLYGGAGMLELHEIEHLAGALVDCVGTMASSDKPLSADEFQQLAVLLDEIDARLDASDDAEYATEPDGDNGAAARTQPTPPPHRSAESAPSAGRLADLPPELLEVFALEAHEHNEAIQRGLEHLRTQPDDTAMISDMRRVTHTLKGAAASVGLTQMAHLAHLMEEAFELVLTGEGELQGQLTRTVIELLFDSADVLDGLLDADQATTAGELLTGVDQQYLALLGDAYPHPEKSAVPPPDSDDLAPLQAAPRVDDMLRLPLSDMDILINRVGEVIINRAGLERLLSGLENLLVELNYSNSRLQRVASDIDAQIEVTVPAARSLGSGDGVFDPLEMDRYSLLYQLTRELEELAADSGDINSQLDFLVDDLSAGLVRERRLTSDLQDNLLAMRLVPFHEIETRMRRTVHRTARDLDKPVDLIITGFETKVDKTILDALADPLMHLIRNAVDHGIEVPAARRAAKKPAQGLVRLSVTRERGRVIVQLADDGGGINFQGVRQRAIAMGLLAPEDRPTQQALLDLLFHEGFSMAEAVTQTSGRGMGLDIVRRAVNRLQGTLRVDTEPGRGTTFTISVPVTLAITRALYIQVCGQQFAVPLEQIGLVLRLDEDLLDQITAENVLRYDGRNLAVFHLADYVRGPQSSGSPTRYGLVTELGDQEAVVLVEQMAGIHEAVVKSLGSHLRRVVGVMGATIAGDGRVILILDLLEIISHEYLADETGQYSSQVTASGPDMSPTPPHVLVVDDSPSVRRVVSSFLERVGWRTTKAKDGIDALEKLAAERPDVALVDIEMPRMNGYDLLAHIKSDPGLRALPVVFLTSRSAAKHRDRAAQLGVDGYLVKPYHENELLEELLRVTQRARQVVR
ncbi:MAG: response regulator [Chloroflexi bacterium]|nr:response regulator [Chloroflexota bacterium]